MASSQNMVTIRKKDMKSTWKSMLKFPHILSIIILALITTVHYLTGKNGNVVSLENIVSIKQEKIVSCKNGDMFSGRWVYDDVSYPLYEEGECSFMENDFACARNGRKNLKYQKWRWQPHQCDLPRFNGTAFLEKIRGKKLIYVGDSLNRNQWRSMLCLIESYLPPLSDKTLKVRGNLYYFHSKEYKTTIGFYWSPFLVESNCDDLFRHESQRRVLRIKSIGKHGRHWSDADILVFDSFVWWNQPTMSILYGSFGRADEIKKEVKMKQHPYEIGINTWSEWLEMNINRTKTKLFFMGFSPYRLGDTYWRTSASCYNESEPIVEESYWPNAVNRSMMEILESTIEKLEQRGVKVEYLNITQLSSYRDDAHLSIYRSFSPKIKKIFDPLKHSDCLHWCLPGVPDIWNQFLYAHIMKG